MKTGFCGLQSGSKLGFAPYFLGFLQVWGLGPGITGHLSMFAAVEEFALQNFPQTRAKLDGCKAAACTARLAQGPMTAEAVNAAGVAFKKALIKNSWPLRYF